MNIAIKIEDKSVLKYWIDHPTYKNAQKNEDVGLDLPIGNSIKVPAKAKAFSINMGIQTSPEMGFMLVPRSSISKTPLRMSNSIGIIDKSYRGNIIAKVDNLSNNEYLIEEGKCLFQIVAFNGILPQYEIVDDLNETSRGKGGFGSTTNIN